MPYETLIYQNKGRAGIVTLNRPERRNALSLRLKAELGAVFDEMEADESVKVVILTGGERVFCAGSDIQERVDTDMTPAVFHQTQKQTHRLFHKIEKFEKPVLAAVSGFAVGGGCELVLVCDLVLASETAMFGVPEVKVGMIPAGGATQRLPRLIGMTRAKELIYTGDVIDAQEAYRLGLVNKIVPGDRLMSEALCLADKIANNPPLALRLAKEAVNTGMQLDLGSALDYETVCAALVAGSEDRKEGFHAFLEKRKPVFKGR